MNVEQLVARQVEQLVELLIEQLVEQLVAVHFDRRVARRMVAEIVATRLRYAWNTGAIDSLSARQVEQLSGAAELLKLGPGFEAFAAHQVEQLVEFTFGSTVARPVEQLVERVIEKLIEVQSEIGTPPIAIEIVERGAAELN